MKGEYIFRNGVDIHGLFGVRVWFKKNWYTRAIVIANKGFSELFFDTESSTGLAKAQHYVRMSL